MPRRSKTCVFAIQAFHTAPLSSGRIVPRLTIAEVNYIHLTLQSNTTLNGAFFEQSRCKIELFYWPFSLMFCSIQHYNAFWGYAGGGGGKDTKIPLE